MAQKWPNPATMFHHVLCRAVGGSSKFNAGVCQRLHWGNENYYYYFFNFFWPSVDMFPREFKNWDIQNWVQIYRSVQSGVGNLSCNKTALKRCTSTETLWNRKAPSLSSPEDEEIFLPKLPMSWHADVFKGPKVSTAIGAKRYWLPMLAYFSS